MEELEKCKECGSVKIYCKQLCNKCYQKQNWIKHKPKKLAAARKWKQENKEYVKTYSKQYWEKNGETLNAKRKGDPKTLAQRKEYYYKNQEELKLKSKWWRAENKEHIKNYMKDKYIENPEKFKKLTKKWQQQNPEKVRAILRKQYHTKNKFNPLYKISSAIRKDLRLALTQKNFPKRRHTFELLGYSPEDLKVHLEKQFDDKMNWENYGSYWHIDHVVPLSWFKTEEEIIKANQLNNLQPLEATENMRKGNRFASK